MGLDLKLSNLPLQPGVYMMQDFLGNIIYVGKAKNLKKRVSQYFQEQKDRDPKVAEMIRHIHSLECVVTDTELEALMQECRLIKKIKPKYNSLMKNELKYCYIKIPAEPYPKVIRTMEKVEDGALYFGPFASRHVVEKVLQYLYEAYPLRRCRSQVLVKRRNGCLSQQMGACAGVCTGAVSPADYQVYINFIIKLLNGKDRSVLPDLKTKMKKAADKLEFEKAAAYQEYIRGLQSLIARQKLIHSSARNRNIAAIEKIDAGRSKLFLIRGNKLLYTQVIHHPVNDPLQFTHFLKQTIQEYLGSVQKGNNPLKLQDIDEAQILYSYLRNKKHNIVSYLIPPCRPNNQEGIEAAVGKIMSCLGINFR